MTINKLLLGRPLPDPRETELLLAAILKQDQTYLISHGETRVSAAARRRFAALIARRRHGEPMAYLLGTQPFYGLTFVVDRRVLIPRPESEWLVENGLAILRTHRLIRTVVDIGTGSGCIIISLLKNFTLIERRQVTAYATDISRDALAVARRNAKLHKITTIKFFKGNLFQPINNNLTAYGLQFTAPILLLANLPYLTNKDYGKTPMGVRLFEPKAALEAGPDGLRYYHRLIKQLTKFPDLIFHCLWEIDPCHSQKLIMLVRKTFPKAIIHTHKDHNGLERYLAITIPELLQIKPRTLPSNEFRPLFLPMVCTPTLRQCT